MPYQGTTATSRALVSRVGSTITYKTGSLTVTDGILVARFLTRWGVFTEADLESGWVLIGRVRMLGPWFDGDEVWNVVVARHADPVPPAVYTITSSVDAAGIALDAPLVLPEGWYSNAASGGGYQYIRSVGLATDQLTGERDYAQQLSWTMPGGWTNLTSLHIGQRDAAYLLDYAAHAGIGVESPLAERRWRKQDVLTGDPASGSGTWDRLYVKTRSVIRWSDGEDETRVRDGADTVIQRIGIQFSDALPSPGKPVIRGGAQWVDPAAAWSLDVDYQSDLAGGVSALVWRRVDESSVVSYWNQATQLWQAGVYENVRATPSQSWPPGSMTADVTYTLSVAARGTVGGLSVYSDPVTVDTHPKPAATIDVAPSAGGVVSSLTPTVTPGGTPASGQTLTGYQVEVLTSTGTQWAYADLAGSLSPWIVTPPLPNNTTGWAARIRVEQTGGALSDWVTAGFDVAAVTPGAPTVTVSAAEHDVSGLPVARLTVDLPWETDGFDYASNVIAVDVDRSVDDGVTWERVGSVSPTPGWATGIVIDDDAPSHLTATYRARASATTTYGGVLDGAWGYAPGYVGPSGETWLYPLGFPELAVRVDLVSADDGQVTSNRTGVHVIGAPHQVVTGVAAVAAAGGYVARTDTPDDEAALVGLLSAGHLLSLSMSEEKDLSGWRHQVPRRWFRTVGDIAAARVAQGPWTARLVSWQAVPQQAPTSTVGA